MKKKCKECGKGPAFELWHQFEVCHQCSRSLKNFEKNLLQSYYDRNGNLIKEVYLETPEEIAKVFAKSKLATKQLRDFFTKIRSALNTGYFKGMDKANPLLWKCSPDLEYQLGREIIPPSFYKFMKHHLSLAENNLNNLKGFFEHLQSVLAFFTKEKGGET